MTFWLQGQLSNLLDAMLVVVVLLVVVRWLLVIV